MLFPSPSCPGRNNQTRELIQYLDSQDVIFNDTGNGVQGGTDISLIYFSAQTDDSQSPQFKQAVDQAIQGGWTPEKYKKIRSLFSKNPRVPYAIIIAGGRSTQSMNLRSQGTHKTMIGINSSMGADHFTDEKYVQGLGEHELIHFVLSQWQHTLIDAENYPTALDNFIQFYKGPDWKIQPQFPNGIGAAFAKLLFPSFGQDALQGAYEIEEAIIVGLHARQNLQLVQHYFDQYWFPKQDQAIRAYGQGRIRLFELTWGMANACLHANLLNRPDVASQLRHDYIEAVRQKQTNPVVKEHIAELFDYCLAVYTTVSDLLVSNSSFTELHQMYSVPP